MRTPCQNDRAPERFNVANEHESVSVPCTWERTREARQSSPGPRNPMRQASRLIYRRSFSTCGGMAWSPPDRTWDSSGGVPRVTMPKETSPSPQRGTMRMCCSDLPQPSAWRLFRPRILLRRRPPPRPQGASICRGYRACRSAEVLLPWWFSFDQMLNCGWPPILIWGKGTCIWKGVQTGLDCIGHFLFFFFSP